MRSSSEPEDHDRPRAAELLRTIAINLQLGDPLYRLIAVDLYNDAVTVRWTREWADTTAPIEEDYLLGPAGARLDITDDLGTEYETHGSGGGTLGVASVHVTRLFSPAPPARARKLVLTYADEIVTVPLHHDDALPSTDAAP